MKLGCAKEIEEEYIEARALGAATMHGAVAQYMYWCRLFEYMPRGCLDTKVCLITKRDPQEQAGFLSLHHVLQRCWKHTAAASVTELCTNTKGYTLVFLGLRKLLRLITSF